MNTENAIDLIQNDLIRDNLEKVVYYGLVPVIGILGILVGLIFLLDYIEEKLLDGKIKDMMTKQRNWRTKHGIFHDRKFW